jgi:hypothetical protein
MLQIDLARVSRFYLETLFNPPPDFNQYLQESRIVKEFAGLGSADLQSEANMATLGAIR